MADVVCESDEAAVHAQVFGDWDGEMGGAGFGADWSGTAVIGRGFIVVELVRVARTNSVRGDVFSSESSEIAATISRNAV